MKTIGLVMSVFETVEYFLYFITWSWGLLCTYGQTIQLLVSSVQTHPGLFWLTNLLVWHKKNKSFSTGVKPSIILRPSFPGALVIISLTAWRFQDKDLEQKAAKIMVSWVKKLESYFANMSLGHFSSVLTRWWYSEKRPGSDIGCSNTSNRPSL